LDQAGLKGFEVKVWHGLYTPKNVPQAIQTKLNTALKAALNDPDVKKRLADSNIDVVSMDKVSANGLKTHLDSEINKWGPVIRKANIPD
jgi:tripartite-type tricarboxylate transporter receptor subunit TctC